MALPAPAPRLNLQEARSILGLLNDPEYPLTPEQRRTLEALYDSIMDAAYDYAGLDPSDGYDDDDRDIYDSGWTDD